MAIAVAPEAGLWSALVRPVGVNRSSDELVDGVLLLLVVDATSDVLLGTVEPVSRLAAALGSVAVRGAVDEELIRLRSLVDEDVSLVAPEVEGVLLATGLVVDVSVLRVPVGLVLGPLSSSVSGESVVEDAVAIDDDGPDVGVVVLLGWVIDAGSVLEVDGVLAIPAEDVAPALVLDVCSVAKSERINVVVMLSASSERTSSLLKGTRNFPLVPANPSFASIKASAFPD